MPISKKKDGWYYGSQGPFPSEEKANEVRRAIHAQKVSKGLRKKKK